MSSEKRANLSLAVSNEVRKFLAGVILFNQQVAEQVGLNATDLQCLHLLQLQGSATPGQLAAWSGLTTGGITVVLDRLERAGYARRTPNPNDRRSSIVKPVRAAMRKLEALYRSKGERLMRVLSEYTERELLLILDFFEQTNRPS
jgi:DNA-binding MarR family transcriptional regulator